MPRRFTPVLLAIAALLPITACGPRSESDWLGGYRPEWNNSPQQQQTQQQATPGAVCCNSNGNPYAEARDRGLEYAPPEQVLSPVEQQQPRFSGASQAVDPQYSDPVTAQQPAQTEPSFANPY